MSINRREFLVGCSAAVAAMAGAQLRRLAFAAPPLQGKDDPILVVIFLRGGWDALNVVAPLDGPDREIYERARPTLRLPLRGKNKLLPLNELFGLNAACKGLHEIYRQGDLAFVHAAGMPADTRSHFDAMDYMELGTPDQKSIGSGWLQRYISELASGAPGGLLPVIATEGQPLSLLGIRQAVVVRDPAEFGLWDNGTTYTAQMKALRLLHRGDHLLNQAGWRTLDAIEAVESMQARAYTPAHGARYRDWGFGLAMRTIAQMIKMDSGLRVATVDMGGWDTHQSESWGDGDGILYELLSELSDGLTAFYTDMDDLKRRISVLVMSEFGRRLAQNESQGTDHGHGGLMLALGGGINGGKMLGSFPGLENDQLYDHADLAVTSDFRQVIGEVVAPHLVEGALENVFPGFVSGAPLGLRV